MEVLKQNFLELFPKIQQAVQEADFVAIDTELTGLQPIKSRLFFLDSPQQRYSKLRHAANSFLVIQFGLCTFTWSREKNGYISKPFNFYVFPGSVLGESGGNERTFLCQSGSLEFLSGCNFDFNKMIASGIPYVNRAEELALKARRENEANNPDIPIDDNNRDFFEQTKVLIDTWLQDSTEKALEVPAGNGYLRRLVYQIVRNNYNGFVSAQKKDRNIEIVKLSVEEKDKNAQDADNREAEFSKMVNFSSVIQLMIDAQKPIVGHNCFLDMCHTMRHFVDDLPLHVKEWKNALQNLWSLVIDTKHIANQHPTLQPLIQNQPSAGSTALSDLTALVQQEPFLSAIPDIDFDPEFTRYSTSDSPHYHEAGYDAHCTGVVFLRLTHYLLSQEEFPVTNVSKALLTSPALTSYYNKLNLMRSDLKTLNLTGAEEAPEPRATHFILTSIPPNFRNNDLQGLFEHLGTVSIHWVDDWTCCIALHDETKVAQMPVGRLGDARNEVVEEDGEIQESKPSDNIVIHTYADWWNQILFDVENASPAVHRKRPPFDPASVDRNSKVRRLG
ncbi:CAF1-domain-containing protein [Basidiobolus meristosporus CBS 931.73]|uniref:CAF1-domain-containing protein n=1 Tax=Basidiobolus meristosporus CBS 931.73 TaxID=1314790 RepID=A0A1Y1Y8T4_9FUNG|nr:CAF1-domain-containing protein [Basidiobolus meristosporus CBS 931.73]|eukprot:ORX94409.1 CAF1-domain-containing protein [Basidiobolus meristosporus CBS 931.73]